MEIEEVQLCESVSKKDRMGRRVSKARERDRLLKLYDRSELTQTAFCQRHGVNIHTFVAWLGKRRQQQSANRFHEVMLPMPDEVKSAVQLEVLLLDGTQIVSQQFKMYHPSALQSVPPSRLFFIG